MTETPEVRLRRIGMRAWRRGTREMDLVLGPYADAHLAGMPEAEVDLFDRLLEQNDHDIAAWMLGQASPPDRFAALVRSVAGFARRRFAAGN
jgi:antitoxin CptB